MEHTGLSYIKGSKGYIYAAFKDRSDEGVSFLHLWHKYKHEMANIYVYTPLQTIQGASEMSNDSDLNCKLF